MEESSSLVESATDKCYSRVSKKAPSFLSFFRLPRTRPTDDYVAAAVGLTNDVKGAREKILLLPLLLPCCRRRKLEKKPDCCCSFSLTKMPKRYTSHQKKDDHGKSISFFRVQLWQLEKKKCPHPQFLAWCAIHNCCCVVTWATTEQHPLFWNLDMRLFSSSSSDLFFYTWRAAATVVSQATIVNRKISGNQDLVLDKGKKPQWMRGQQQCVAALKSTTRRGASAFN